MNRERLLEQFSQQMYGRSRKDEACVQCGSDKVKPEDFKDDLSRKEFTLTRWCGPCQDNFFNTDPE